MYWYASVRSVIWESSGCKGRLGGGAAGPGAQVGRARCRARLCAPVRCARAGRTCIRLRRPPDRASDAGGSGMARRLRMKVMTSWGAGRKLWCWVWVVGGAQARLLGSQRLLQRLLRVALFTPSLIAIRRNRQRLHCKAPRARTPPARSSAPALSCGLRQSCAGAGSAVLRGGGRRQGRVSCAAPRAPAPPPPVAIHQIAPRTP